MIRAARVAKIVATIDGCPLADIDHEASWFRIWSKALGYGARVPSHATRQAVREAVRKRLPAPYVLTREDRDILEEMERARALGAQP